MNRLIFPDGSEVKVSASNVGDPGLIPGSGRSPGERNGNPLQYYCLENPMDRGAWKATVHGVAKGWTCLSDFTFTFTYAFRSSLVKGEWGPYIVTAFFICCMWEKSMPSYWGISCPWALTFLNTGKAKRSSASETRDCKASKSESLCHEGEWVDRLFL